ncbi:MAG TPA: TonB-dependent receptor [Terriglobia bacterium]|nr:TonB-dependent receptor [Terriglobia bacterium]
MAKIRRSSACLWAVLFLVGSGLVWGQTDRGTITGSVTDPSGAVIVGATVTATNVATGVSTRTTTSSAGDYTIPLLRPGTYELTIEQSGFKKFVQTRIILEVGQTIRVDAKLQIGQTTQLVEVTAQPVPIQKDTSSRATVVSSRDVEELPIVSQAEQRNPGFYMTLAPGVTGRATAAPSASGSGRQLNTTVNGSQSGSTEFYLDGAVIGQTGQMSGDFRRLPFPPDAVGEFNVMTLNPPADYGDTGLGVTSFSLKSGTNEFHGSIYEYLRNDTLDARGFFAPKTPINKQNEFGATAGGPVVIPKLYNGKDKTFFFGWYHGFRLAQQVSNTLDTLPTEAMKQGDESNILGSQVGTDALGRPIYSGEIYDPNTTRTVAAGAVDPVTGLTNTSGKAAVLRDGFGFNPLTGQPIAGAANVIPSSRIDPVAAKMFSYFPNPPACPKCDFGYRLNWLAQFPVHTTINQWGSKIDHAISDRNRIMGDMIWWKSYAPTGSKWPKPIGEGSLNYIQQDIARFAHDFIMRSNLVNHWVAGFNRLRSDSYPEAGNGWPAILGYSGVPQSGPGSTWPELDISGLGNAYARQGQSYQASNIFTFDDILTWTKGRHTIRTGFSYIKMQQNSWGTSYQSSKLQFNSGVTSLPGDFYSDGCVPGGQCTGFGAAGFLLGDVSTGLAGIVTAVSAERTSRYAGFVQDDFKLTPKLTFNLGLRYDLMTPVVDAHNVKSWMDPNVPNKAAGGLKGALVFASPSHRAAAHADTKAFGPRIGLAYAVNDKTVVRTGYGIIYASGGAYRPFGSGWPQLGFSSSNGIQEDVSTGFTGALPAFTLQGGWPASRFTPPPFIDPAYMNGQGPPTFGAFPGDGNLPYMQTWSFDIQRQIPGQILLDVAYVGTKGTHLPSRLMNSNVMPTSDLKYQDLIFANIASPSVQGLPVVQAMPVDPATGMHSPFPGFQALWGGGATLGQALRPMPQYTADTVEGLSQLRDFGEVVGNSSYNALQIQARKHFSQGLSFLASYTWSKTLTDAESQFNEFSGFTQDFYNARAEKALSINDYPSNLVISYEYQLPFGPGKKFANIGGPAGKVIGGWSIAGVQQYQSGAPQIIVTGGNPFNPYVGPNGFLMRPNVVPGVPKKSAAILNGTWDPNAPGAAGAVININAWADPAANPATKWTLGNAPRTDGAIRRFPYLNEDISLLKRTNITERVSVEFRADFLNLFNRTLFGFDYGGDQYGSILQGNNLGAGIGGFGHITSQSNFPREIQFGLKITY